MTKRILQLYVDAEAIALAKQKQLNLSSLFRGMLETELNLNKNKDKTEELKLKVAKLTSALEEANKTIEKLKKEKDKHERKDRTPLF